MTNSPKRRSDRCRRPRYPPVYVPLALWKWSWYVKRVWVVQGILFSIFSYTTLRSSRQGACPLPTRRNLCCLPSSASSPTPSPRTGKTPPRRPPCRPQRQRTGQSPSLHGGIECRWRAQRRLHRGRPDGVRLYSARLLSATLASSNSARSSMSSP